MSYKSGRIGLEIKDRPDYIAHLIIHNSSLYTSVDIISKLYIFFFH